MMKSLLSKFCLMVGWLWLLAISGTAQTVQGRVLDANGAPLSGVAITVNQCAGNGPRTVQSDGAGMFEWVYPAGCGTYFSVTYTFEKTGFEFRNYRLIFGNPALLQSSVDERYPIVYGIPTSAQKWTGVSAASYAPNLPFSSGMLVAGFGTNIATGVFQASTIPLPSTLGGRKIAIRDGSGKEVAASLVFVSTSQINYVTPATLANGPAVIKLLDESNNLLRLQLVVVEAKNPGLFTFDASGRGVPAGYIIRVRGNVQTQENIARFDTTTQSWVRIPIDLGLSTDLVYLVLYGTGWRNLAYPSAIYVSLGGTACTIAYHGASSQAGVDQINVLIPHTLAGRGNVVLSAERDFGVNEFAVTIK